MKKFIEWHKLQIGKVKNFLRIDNYQTLWLSWAKGFIMGIILMMLLSGCYVSTGTSSYNDPNYETVYTTYDEIYYWDGNVYYGYYAGYYYYYGTPHYHPWWHYYLHRPSFNYHINTHIHIHCDNGHYVYGHRGNKFNNKKGGKFKPNRVKIKTNHINSKTNPKVNTTVKPNNKIKINKNNITNHPISTPPIKNNTNKNNTNKTNINKSNKSNKVKINRSNSNKSSKPTFNNKNTNRNKNSRKPR